MKRKDLENLNIVCKLICDILESKVYNLSKDEADLFSNILNVRARVLIMLRKLDD